MRFVMLILVCLLSFRVHVGCKSLLKSQAQLRSMCLANSNIIGLNEDEITRARARNDNCALDCATRFGSLETLVVNQNVGCGQGDENNICSLGKCRTPEETLLVDTNKLWSIEVRVPGARINNLTLSETEQTFVNIEALRNYGPSYDSGEQVCHLKLIRPAGGQSLQEFVCKPLPMNWLAMLRFGVWQNTRLGPEFLGSAEERLDHFLNLGQRRIELRGIEDASIEVEVMGVPYKRPD